jgi:hypothetical protein
MDPKLIEAIALRIKVGHSKEEIQVEMKAIGYGEEDFVAAYKAATDSISAATSVVLANEVPIDNSATNISLSAASSDLPEYGILFKQSWELLNGNIKLLLKGVITFIGTLIFAGVIAVLLTVYIPTISAGDFILKFVLLFILLIFTTLALIACFAGLLRGLLKRKESQRYTKHFIWAYLNIVGVSLVSIYVNIVTQMGYFLLFVPGFLLSIYLVFSLYFVIGGHKKGVSALTASTAVIYGRFWGVFFRLFASVVFLAFFLALATGLVFLLVLVNPFFVPTILLIIVAFALITSFWQLCFTVALFESLVTLPVAKPLPIKESTLINGYRIIIGVVIAGMVFLFTLGSLGIIEITKDESSKDSWSKNELMMDIENKKALKLATEIADSFLIEKGSFTGVCAGLQLPAGTVCESNDRAYVIEAPLSWGFYCVDSSGYNEVRRRSGMEAVACKIEQEAN